MEANDNEAIDRENAEAIFYKMRVSHLEKEVASLRKRLDSFRSPNTDETGASYYIPSKQLVYSHCIKTQDVGDESMGEKDELPADKSQQQLRSSHLESAQKNEEMEDEKRNRQKVEGWLNSSTDWRKGVNSYVHDLSANESFLLRELDLEKEKTIQAYAYTEKLLEKIKSEKTNSVARQGKQDDAKLQPKRNEKDVIQRSSVCEKQMKIPNYSLGSSENSTKCFETNVPTIKYGNTSKRKLSSTTIDNKACKKKRTKS